MKAHVSMCAHCSTSGLLRCYFPLSINDDNNVYKQKLHLKNVYFFKIYFYFLFLFFTVLRLLKLLHEINV